MGLDGPQSPIRYLVEWGQERRLPFGRMEAAGLTTKMYTGSGVIPGELYHVLVYAVDKDNRRSMPALGRFRGASPAALKKAKPPTDVSLTRSGTTGTLTWTTAASVSGVTYDGYDIQYAVEGGNWGVASKAVDTATRQGFTGWDANQNYCARIRTSTSTANALDSEWVEVCIDTPELLVTAVDPDCNPVRNIRSVVSFDRFVVIWGWPLGLVRPTGYEIQFLPPGEIKWTAVKTISDQRNFDDIKAVKDGAYAARVRPVYPDCEVEWAYTDARKGTEGLYANVAGFDLTGRLLSANGRWGGNGRGYLDRVPSANGQMLIENADGGVDLQNIRINQPVGFYWVFDGHSYPLLEGVGEGRGGGAGADAGYPYGDCEVSG